MKAAECLRAGAECWGLWEMKWWTGQRELGQPKTTDDEEQWETHNHYQSDCGLFSESFFGMARDENYFVAMLRLKWKRFPAAAAATIIDWNWTYWKCLCVVYLLNNNSVFFWWSPLHRAHDLFEFPRASLFPQIFPWLDGEWWWWWDESAAHAKGRPIEKSWKVHSQKKISVWKRWRRERALNL